VSVVGNSKATTLNAFTQPCSPPPPPPPSPPPPPPPPPGGEPPPIAGQGYAVTFQDQFDIFDGGNWGEGIWYDPGSPPNSIYVQNGVLQLVSRKSQGYQDITVSTEGGSDPKTFQYGYLEARMRWTAGNGAWPAFWLMSYRHAANPDWPSINSYCAEHGLPAAECYSGEVDVFEGQGSQPATFYHTIHKNSCGCYGVADEQNAANWTNGVDLSGFHTYAILWTANEMKWYLDDNLIDTEKASDSARNGRIFDALRQPMFVLLQMWIGGWTVGTDSSTPDELHTEVDWLRVWQQ
jgi:beta-glucanase (GH16 family)